MSDLDLLDDLEHYRRLFTDLTLWTPWVERVLARHNLSPIGPVRLGVPGTCPVFIAGERWVVKFFGRLFDGARSAQVEREAALLVRNHPVIGAAPLAAWGALEEGRWPWPYLVFAYLPGESFGQARERLSTAERLEAARWMGRAVRALHDLPLGESMVFPAHPEAYRRFLEEQRAGAVERHRAWGILPARLVEQIPAFVPPVEQILRPGRMHLIHADLTADHLLGREEGGRWQPRALIDFGDAMVGDLFYELGALHLDLFAADCALLAAFLEAYRLPPGEYAGLPRRALCAALLHRFALFSGLSRKMLDACPSLEALAERLFTPGAGAALQSPQSPAPR